MKNDFRTLLDEFIEFKLKSSPVSATYKGIHTYDHLLDDLSHSNRIEYLKILDDYEKKLSEFEESELDDIDTLDRKLLLSAIKTELRYEREYKILYRDANYYPDICLYGINVLLLRDFAPLTERLWSVKSRLLEIPRLLEQGVENLKSSTNIPRIWTEIAIEAVKGGLKFFENVIPDAANKSENLKEEILKANELAIKAMCLYRDFLKENLLPRSNGEFAFGKKLFNQVLEEYHMVPYSVDDLIKIGEDNITSIRKAMDDICKQIEMEGDWPKIVENIKNDHPAAEELLEFYSSEMARARDFVRDNDLADIPDGEMITVMETPIFLRGIIPYGAYMTAAPFDERQEGFFWVTPVDPSLPAEKQEEQLRGHNRWGATIVALHEAYPGHHLQFIHKNKIKNRARHFFATNVFIEGWALYCEEMMYEQGFYSDLRSRLLQLKDELWRACRIVIDAKLHTGRMTYEEAVDMLVNTAQIEPVNAEKEVKRYTKTPTQPMSYLIGKIEILKLRE
ncbi:MAG: DUF885 domain-containing protein, partial [candidate division Zixibacteria bacterium]|nr:DUF885 domain-containing protein [candidate division Zixibacteria bacterium]